MDLQEFLNMNLLLRGFEATELPFLSQGEFYKFKTDPVRYLVRTDEDIADQIWQTVEHSLAARSSINPQHTKGNCV